MSRRRAVLLLALAAVGLAGCTATADDAPFATYPRPDAGMDALLMGTLEMRDGCLVVDTGEGDVLPVFPEGDAQWGEEVLTWKGESFDIGAQISLGGGYSGAIANATIPAACADDVEVFAVSPF